MENYFVLYFLHLFSIIFIPSQSSRQIYCHWADRSNGPELKSSALRGAMLPQFTPPSGPSEGSSVPSMSLQERGKMGLSSGSFDSGAHSERSSSFYDGQSYDMGQIQSSSEPGTFLCSCAVVHPIFFFCLLCNYSFFLH